MSSPIHDDRDKRAMYVPPWARDELRDEETRRIHAEIVAAAERLKPPAQPPAAAAEAATGRPAAGDGFPDTRRSVDEHVDVRSCRWTFRRRERDAGRLGAAGPRSGSRAAAAPAEDGRPQLGRGLAAGGRGRICGNRRAVRDRCDPAAVDRYLRVSRSQGCKCGRAFGCRGAQQCKAAGRRAAGGSAAGRAARRATGRRLAAGAPHAAPTAGSGPSSRLRPRR